MSQLTFTAFAPSAPAQTGTRALDQFFTPEWAAERLVELFFGDLTNTDQVIDAGCGRGPFLKAIPSHIPAFGVEIDPVLAAEARENTGRDVIIGDFRAIAPLQRPTAIIGNPPFSRRIIDGFLAHGHELLPENGRCGFILPASYLSFASTMERIKDRFSVRADSLPRDLFPRISVPISFFLFTKESVRRHRGFVLFDEAAAIRGLAKSVKLALYRGENRQSPWHTAVARTLASLGGRASLDRIYSAMEGRLPRPIATWKDTVRRVLQEGGFVNVARGEWATA